MKQLTIVMILTVLVSSMHLSIVQVNKKGKALSKRWSNIIDISFYHFITIMLLIFCKVSSIKLPLLVKITERAVQMKMQAITKQMMDITRKLLLAGFWCRGSVTENC